MWRLSCRHLQNNMPTFKIVIERLACDCWQKAQLKLKFFITLFMQAYKKQCGRPEIRKSQQVLIDKAKFSNSSSKNVSIV